MRGCGFSNNRLQDVANNIFPSLRKLARPLAWLEFSTYLARSLRHCGNFDLPPLDVLKQQHRDLCRRLKRKGENAHIAKRWNGASGTAIYYDLYHDSELRDGLGGIMHLYSLCASHSACEAVAEGAGGVWDRSAADGRHLDFESSAEGGVVAWNAPHPHQEPAATTFVTATLNHHFGPKKWNFRHTDRRAGRIDAWAHVGGKVVKRLANVQPRLPAEFYGVEPEGGS